MREIFALIVIAAGILSTQVIVIAGLVLAVVILVAALLLFRSGGKSKKAAKAASQQGTPGAWNQQGMGADNPWGQGMGQQPGAWGAQSQGQQPGGWGGQSAQQQPGAWGAQSQGQQPANPWGAQSASQGAAQPQWNSQLAGASGMGGQQPAWDATMASQQPAPPDPWAQQQGASSSPAWGTPNSASAQPQPSPPTAYSGSGSSPSWGQPAPSADPWGQPAPAQQGAWGQPFQQQGAGSTPSNVSPAAPSWQQQGQDFGSNAPGTGAGGFGSTGRPDAAALFGTNDGDRTMLRPPTGPQGVSRIGIVRVEEGKEPGRVYEVRKESLTIGRSRESDIFLEDLAVSRNHAAIVSLGNGNYALKDEGSANGTKVNGQMVNKYQTYPLQEGDRIQLGQTVLVFARR